MEKAMIKQTKKKKNHTADSLKEGRLAFYCPKGVMPVRGETMAISNREYT